MKKRKNKSYTTDFKQEAVAVVTEHGYCVSAATTSLGITSKLIYNYLFINGKLNLKSNKLGVHLMSDERAG